MTEGRLKEIESAFVLAFDEDVLIRELVAEVRRLRSPRTCPSCFETMLTPEHCKKMDEWIATQKENQTLRELLEEALVVMQCLESEQGREWDLRKRIHAALEKK